jgi:hypothetical protein
VGGKPRPRVVYAGKNCVFPTSGDFIIVLDKKQTEDVKKFLMWTVKKS